jgi:hypothetical protein
MLITLRFLSEEDFPVACCRVTSFTLSPGGRGQGEGEYKGSINTDTLQLAAGRFIVSVMK